MRIRLLVQTAFEMEMCDETDVMIAVGVVRLRSGYAWLFKSVQLTHVDTSNPTEKVLLPCSMYAIVCFRLRTISHS